MKTFIIAAVTATLLSACGTTVPECHDPEVKQQVMNQFMTYTDKLSVTNFGDNDLIKKIVNETKAAGSLTVSVDSAVQESVDEKTKGRKCSITASFTMKPEYDSALAAIYSGKPGISDALFAGIMDSEIAEKTHQYPNITRDQMSVHYLNAKEKANSAAIMAAFAKVGNTKSANDFLASTNELLQMPGLTVQEVTTMVYAESEAYLTKGEPEGYGDGKALMTTMIGNNTADFTKTGKINYNVEVKKVDGQDKPVVTATKSDSVVPSASFATIMTKVYLIGDARIKNNTEKRKQEEAALVEKDRIEHEERIKAKAAQANNG